MKCEMLDSFGIWGEVELMDSEFKFKCLYGRDIEIWEGKNKELFVLRKIKKSKA